LEYQKRILMFARVKKSGIYNYLQIVQNYREGTKTKQRVIATLGRLDELKGSRDIENLVHSLAKYSDKALMVLSGKSDINAHSVKIGPALIFDRLWNELKIPHILSRLLENRKYEFDVERAIFVTVLHRLFVSGSDRSCEKWKEDYRIEGADELELQHFYRAMAFLGEELEEQRDRTPFSPRCTKDLVEEGLFANRRDLFTTLDLVYFDTTSTYFEGRGGETIGRLGNSKDNRPDLRQMIVGAVLDNKGTPLCCELWPGNTTDVKTLLPVTDRIRSRFEVGEFCIVADRGMISSTTIKGIEERKVSYILGCRMRKVKEISHEVLSRAGRFKEVYPEVINSKTPSPLKVKEVLYQGKRYIVCLNERQARKEATERQAIVASLEDKLRRCPKKLVSNKGYRKYLKFNKGAVSIDRKKIEQEARYDGKWVLTTNTSLSAEQLALKYKELWQVEQVFRDVKSILHSRPIYHKVDETIRGHMFCSFLALVLRKELDRRLESAGYQYEWFDIKQDLKALQEVIIEEGGQKIAIRTECRGTSSSVFMASGIAIPPSIRRV
jgi:transposase